MNRSALLFLFCLGLFSGPLNAEDGYRLWLRYDRIENEEMLQTDTYRQGGGSTVAKVIDGSLHRHRLTGMAGVANIGTARNWTGHLFGQADWYAFGRLAWDPYLSARDIFAEWTEMTFTHAPDAQATVVDMLDASYETCVR